MVTLGFAVLLATILAGLLFVCCRRKVALPTVVLVLLGLAMAALWVSLSLTATGPTPATTGDRHGHDAPLHDLLGSRTQARGVLPPGNWVWNDANQFKKKQTKQTPPPPPPPVDDDLTAEGAGAAPGVTEIPADAAQPTDTGAGNADGIASATAPAASCDGCTQNTRGPCRHTYLPLCFEFTPNTSECGAHTTLCLDSPVSLEVTEAAREIQPIGDGEQAATAGAHTAQSASADFVFVTASSLNHQCPLLNMLRSLAVSAPSVPVIVYDLENNGSHMDVSVTRFDNTCGTLVESFRHPRGHLSAYLPLPPPPPAYQHTET